MAEMYHLDSGLVALAGMTIQELTVYPGYENEIYGLIDTGVPELASGVPLGETWFYISGANTCYKSTNKKHAYWRAMRDILGESRWEEVCDALEEQGPLKEYLAALDFPTLKRKAQRAKDKGLITQTELTNLAALLP